MQTLWNHLYDARLDAGPRLARGRLAGVGALFGLALAAIFFRACWWEFSRGEEFRVQTERIEERHEPILPRRGAIVSAGGEPLAVDVESWSLAVDYPWLCTPPEEAWLKQEVRRRVPAGKRSSGRLAEARKEILEEQRTLHARLAQLGGLSAEQLQARLAPIRSRVERIAESVNERRRELHAAEAPNEEGRFQRFSRMFITELFAPPQSLPPAPIVVAEQRAPHVVFEEVAEGLAEYVRRRPEMFPGVHVERTARREYPQGELAAHVLGAVGKPLEQTEGQSDSSLVGRSGLELQLDNRLAGSPGERLVAPAREEVLQSPQSGEEVRLTLDVRLQRLAEQLLEESLRRRELRDPGGPPAGGAAVVLEARSGAILAIASAPRFSPAEMASGAAGPIARWQHDPRKPLYHRAVQMALPPGSVFKLVTAAALLEEGSLPPDDSYVCRGYLHSPDELRCALFRSTGEPHGPTDLHAALVQSCNTYFFDRVQRLEGGLLPAWADRLGFGRTTGSGLPGESSGEIPSALEPPGLAVRRQMGIGQGPVTATPLQVAALVATIANGGRRVRPHLLAEETEGATAGRPVLRHETARKLQEAMRDVVADPRGTAHHPAAAGLLAGKTGTAETGGRGAPHAWFAGFAPCEEPEIAIAVVIEHGGDGGSAAAPLARILAERWREISAARLAHRP